MLRPRKRRGGNDYAAVLASGTLAPPSAAAKKKKLLREKRRDIVDSLRGVLQDIGMPDSERASTQTLLQYSIGKIRERLQREERSEDGAAHEQARQDTQAQDEADETHVLWRRALLESEALIVLEVSLESWDVLASSRAMHIFAPASPLSGYVRQRLCVLVHQDDWPVLKDFRDRLVEGCADGKAIELGDVVSVRLLRNFKDEHTNAMIHEYVRLCLEVGHVYTDEGGRGVRAVFTCVPDAGALNPRGRDAGFWLDWYSAVEEGVCGVFEPDFFRTATSSPMDFYNWMQHHNIKLRTDQPQSTLAGILGGIGSSVQARGTSVWFWLTKQLAHVMKVCILVQRGKDQVTPKLQASTSLSLLGLNTDWRTVISVDLSGREIHVGEAAHEDGQMLEGCAQFGVLVNEGLGITGAMALMHQVSPDGHKKVRGMHKTFSDRSTMEKTEIFLGESEDGGQIRFDFKLSRSARPPDALRSRFKEMLNTQDFSLFPIGT